MIGSWGGGIHAYALLRQAGLDLNLGERMGAVCVVPSGTTIRWYLLLLLLPSGGTFWEPGGVRASRAPPAAFLLLQVSAAKRRYEVGLDKLQFTASQVRGVSTPYVAATASRVGVWPCARHCRCCALSLVCADVRMWISERPLTRSSHGKLALPSHTRVRVYVPTPPIHTTHTHTHTTPFLHSPAQVSIMQDELTALKPVLIATVAETERLMATVSKEKTEVRFYSDVNRAMYRDVC